MPRMKRRGIKVYRKLSNYLHVELSISKATPVKNLLEERKRYSSDELGPVIIKTPKTSALAGMLMVFKQNDTIEIQVQKSMTSYTT